MACDIINIMDKKLNKYFNATIWLNQDIDYEKILNDDVHKPFIR